MQYTKDFRARQYVKLKIESEYMAELSKISGPGNILKFNYTVSI